MMSLVLGAGGFIGRHLVEELLSSGQEVVVYDRPATVARIAQSCPQIKPVGGDFQNETRWNEILEGIDVCYHLISTSVPKSSNEDPIGDVSGNLIGSLQLLEVVRRKNVRLVFASSGGTVYGTPKCDVLAEDHPTDPLCCYGITKLAIEKYLRLYHELYGVQSVSLRIANPYGPGQRPNAIQGVIAVFTGRILRGHVVDVWGDGTVVRDYLYIKDVVRALVAASSYGGRQTVFNIGSGGGLSLRDILSAIEDVSGKKADILYHPPRGFDVPKSVLDIANARTYLKWEPQVCLRDGLVKTVDWMLQYLKNNGSD